MLEPPKFRYRFDADDEMNQIRDDFRALRAIVERQDYIIQQNAEMIRLLSELNDKTRKTSGVVIG